MERQRTGIATVTARGVIDIETSRGLAADLSQLAGEQGDAILDLGEVTFMDSIGLGTVLKATGRFARQGKRLVLVAPPGPARDLLEFAGVDGRVEVVSAREEAVAALSDVA